LGMLPYHVFIPSFQGEWGFMMVSPSDPKKEVAFPAGMRVMDIETLTVAFTWPKYWGVWD
jgi:predicted membrane-bound spermidine synthase